jgi:hypothetical protein
MEVIHNSFISPNGKNASGVVEGSIGCGFVSTGCTSRPERVPMCNSGIDDSVSLGQQICGDGLVLQGSVTLSYCLIVAKKGEPPRETE